MIALGLGGITAARLLSHVFDHRLERAIAVLLMTIGLLLISERFLPAGLPALVPAEHGWQVVAGVGLCIGTASTFLGVAGGELLIPTLIFVFGAAIRTAGSTVLFVSIPTVCMGLFRFGRMGLLPRRSTRSRVALPMGVERLIGRRVRRVSIGRNAQALARPDPDRRGNDGVLASRPLRTQVVGGMSVEPL